MLYFSADIRLSEANKGGTTRSPGGVTIAEVIRHAWSRLIRKQWLILYPLSLSIIHSLAFFAVYAAAGESLTWNGFLSADFNRWAYLQELFFATSSSGSLLAVGLVVGLLACALTGMIRAPFFRAVAGPGYPRGPRKWKEVGNLFLFYLITYTGTRIIPVALPMNEVLVQLGSLFATVVALLLVFGDYAIVYEDLGVMAAIRRSMQLLRRRWAVVIIIFLVVQLVWLGLYSLYGLYYNGSSQVFFLLPVSRLLVDALFSLFVDLVLIYLYEDLRRLGPL